MHVSRPFTISCSVLSASPSSHAAFGSASTVHEPQNTTVLSSPASSSSASRSTPDEATLSPSSTLALPWFVILGVGAFKSVLFSAAHNLEHDWYSAAFPPSAGTGRRFEGDLLTDRARGRHWRVVMSR